VIVRQAQLGDADAMARVIAAVAPEGSLGAQPPVDLEQRAEWFRDTIGSEGRSAAWVLEGESGEIVGLLSAHERITGVLSLGMAVVARARSMGGGTRLLDAVVAYGREAGAHKVDLEAWLDNGRAIAFYARAGFEVEGVRRDHYRRRDGSLRSTVIMALPLDRRPAR
jgi:RimJ/RimL family protein N-acetyltransferase